jgi:assimilatory nitrate reductase catalytic subunit
LFGTRIADAAHVKELKSMCCYCGVGCGVLIETDGARILGVRGDPDHPSNFGRLCTKGSTLHLSARHDARAYFPQLRTTREGARRCVSWEEALDHCANQFAAIIAQHGPDAVAFYISGQLLTEDYYVFNKLAKGLIGTNNVDTNSRLCMSSAVAGYKRSLGADAPPSCYEDIEHARCFLIAGSNTAFTHPIVFQRIEAARAANPEIKLIVVDPRRTVTAAAADLFLPILPGTDVALFNGMLHVMLWEGLCDHAYIRAHTEGFEALKDAVREYTPKHVAQLCGLPSKDILQAAEWFAAGPTLSLYCQGLNQSAHGTDNNCALINLHLATGQIGKPGTGPFSLTGQPNAMGGREVGGMANLLPAHRDVANPAHREEIARFWGVDSLPARPGKTAVEMFEAMRAGEIKAVWIACTNPAHSMPDQALVREALARAEFVVVQEAYEATETTEYADVLLPATSWGEKDGTATNSERRINRVRAAIPGPGAARDDWGIACDFARRLAPRLGKSEKLLAYQTAETIFNEHAATTRGRDLDITGLSYALLEARGPQQWPYPAGASNGHSRLYVDGVFATASGRAQFIATTHKGVVEQPDSRHPLRLVTGRLRDQWHGMTRTGTVARLFNHAEEPLLYMHADDLARRGLKTGDIVRVKSRRGELKIKVAANDELRAGQVFLPMHWGQRYMNGAGSNALTLSTFDPVSKQPELKHAAVTVEKLELPWQLVGLRVSDAAAALEIMREAQPLLKYFDYASLNLAGRESPVLVLQAYSRAAPANEVIASVDRALALDDESRSLSYADTRRGIAKRVLVENGRVTGARLAGETAARAWLKDMMIDGLQADAVRTWVLAPLSRPPASARATRGRIVCACLDVSEFEIISSLSEGADLAGMQARLKCGTECGSCVPELKRLCGQAARAELKRA